MKLRNVVSMCAMIVMLMAVVGCGGLDAGDGTTIDDISAATTTPAGTYTISAGFYVSAEWTIEPGTTLVMDPDTWIDIEAAGSIKAIGTADKPITFISSKAAPAKGDWYGIYGDGNGSSFTYCIIKHADTGLELDGSLSSVVNCTFEQNTNGLDLGGAASMTAFSSNKFLENDEPLFINAKYNIDDSNTFTTNTNQRISFNGDTIAVDRTWSVTEVPIYVSSGFYVEKELTLAAGATLVMAPDTWIDIEASGSIKAVGTATSRIAFRSANLTPAKGDWYGIYGDGNGSNFSYCNIKHADTGIDLEGSLSTIDYCLFQYNTVGLDLGAVKSMTSFTTNFFLSNTEPFIVNAALDLDDTNTFTDNTNQRISFNGSTISAARSWSVTQVPLYASAGFHVEAALAIEPGVTLTMSPDSWIDIQAAGSLAAVGTATDDIVFTSSITVPVKGDWNGISVLGSAQFTYCTIEYADRALDVSVASVTLANSTIRHNMTGVYDTDGTLLASLPGTNTFSDNTTPYE